MVTSFNAEISALWSLNDVLTSEGKKLKPRKQMAELLIKTRLFMLTEIEETEWQVTEQVFLLWRKSVFLLLG
jgi:hypothetical protein